MCLQVYKHLGRRELFDRPRGRIGISLSSHGKRINKNVSVV